MNGLHVSWANIYIIVLDHNNCILNVYCQRLCLVYWNLGDNYCFSNQLSKTVIPSRRGLLRFHLRVRTGIDFRGHCCTATVRCRNDGAA